MEKSNKNKENQKEKKRVEKSPAKFYVSIQIDFMDLNDFHFPQQSSWKIIISHIIVFFLINLNI